MDLNQQEQPSAIANLTTVKPAECPKCSMIQTYVCKHSDCPLQLNERKPSVHCRDNVQA